MVKKILVVDDEALLTKTFTLLLERNGYEVLIAKSGQDAQILAEEEKFDLIICDIRMPGVDGVEFAESIKNSRMLNSETPLIFITGYADPEVEKTAKALSPIAYIHKPFDSQEILNMIRKTLGG